MTDTAPVASPDAQPKKMGASLYIRLSIMMFLQFAIWGAWYSVLGDYLVNEGFPSGYVGWVYALLPLACMIAPFVGGQIADRWIPTQVFLAVAHVIGGVGILLSAQYFDQAVPLTASIEYQAALDQGEFPDGFRAAFEENGIRMPADASSVTVTEAGQAWEITGPEGSYTVERAETGERLVVFDGRSVTLLIVFLLLWSLMYGPTLGLTNSLAFHHLPSGEKDFGSIRVWGTIGWILVGWSFTFWLNVNNPDQLPKMLMWAKGLVVWLGGTVASATGEAAAPQYSDCLRFAGWISLVMGAFCLTLPHTPPQKGGEKPWAFVEAFKLLKDWRFAAFLLISFVVSTELMFYFQLTGPFLTDPNANVQVARSNVAAVMTLAQIAEIVTMVLVGWFLPRLGLRWTLAIGIIAWPLRYAIFAIGEPSWLIIAALPLHGVCFVCFFVVAFIYVDKVAPPGIRASAQSLLHFVLYGLGMFLGAMFAGYIHGRFTVEGITNWRWVFLIPTFITIACAVVFFVAFKDPKPDEGVTAKA